MGGVTITDIAREAGVSKATVSRVLNGTTPVNPAKRRAVLEATGRLGFEPSVVARSLSTGRSMTVGVMTQCIGSPFYDAVAQGVIGGLGGTGYSPIFADGQWRREAEVEAVRTLVGRRVDGLVLVGGDVGSGELEELCGGRPTVVVGRQLPGGRHRCISTDNVDGGYQATKHLIDHGHRDIAVVRGIAHHPDSVDRFRGYRRALEDAGIGVDGALVVDGDFSAGSGMRAVGELVARGRLFTAVFAANDAMAFGVRLGLSRGGLGVPGDVSVVGFDDQAEAAFMSPPLTTVRQPARRMGKLAARALLGMIRGEAFESQVFRGELQVRESVARLG